MPVGCHYDGWRASLCQSGQRVRGPVRDTKEEAEQDMACLQAAGREGVPDLRACALALIAEQQACVSSRRREDASYQTLVDVISQWLKQGHCASLPRGSKPLAALASRVCRLEEVYPELCNCAKSLFSEHLAMEAVAEQEDAKWLRDLGIHFRLDYGSRPLHTSGLDSSRAYVGLRNLGNSCCFNSVLQCFFGCGPLREDVSKQAPPKDPLAVHVQRLFRQLSGKDGEWDYVSPAAVLHQLYLTNDVAFEPGGTADVVECCHLLLNSCVSETAFRQPGHCLGAPEHEGGIYLLPRIPARSGESGTTIADLLHANLSVDSWPSTSAVVLRVEQDSVGALSWTEVDAVCKGGGAGRTRNAYILLPCSRFFQENLEKMKPAWATAVEQALKKDAPALERWTEIETILQENRKCYRQVLRPGQVLVHPSNRPGLGLNGAQVHKTGAQVQSVGFSSMELKRSVCMEISTDRAVSQKAFSFNKRQVDMNAGLLAEVRGDERYMSLACSHFTAFCRACIAACPSDQETVSDNGKLTLQRLSTDFRQAVDNGELELAMAMVTRAKLLAEQGLCIDWDVVQADVAGTVPDASPQTVAACGLFCRFYAGGTEAPLLKFLHDFSLKYGASKRLGEEFMSTVAGLRFAGQERSHAFARAAMIATNLTATKVVDGVARLLNKSDVSRLCAKGMEDAVKDWEELLARAWAHTQNVTEASARAKAVECFGRLMVRSTLFMCKKEKSGQEGLEHGSLANLLTLYEHEMGGKSAGATPAAATKDGPSDAAPATLENMQDPAFLMKLQGFAEGNLYKGKQKYQDIWPWKLEKIGQSHGSFSLSCPVSWDKKVEVPLSELKKFFELHSGEFFELCCEYFLKYSQCEEELTFLKNPTCCVLEGKAKTGKLTIFPFTDQISKIGLKPAAGSVEVWHSATGTSLYISPPAAAASLLSAFWQIPVGSEPNLATVLLNEKGWKIPILKNTAPLKECILYRPKPAESLRASAQELDQGSAASRKRKGP
ncbi:unnamed protein product [Symbiodinium sp. CCMP2592]|nr:unnamed protein product [Symbiodinium sp. CCMP2592]